MRTQDWVKRPRRGLAPAAVAILLLANASAGAQETSRTASLDYDAPAHYGTGQCGGEWGGLDDSGAGVLERRAFETFTGETAVELVINDVNPASGTAAAVNQTGEIGDGTVVCGQARLSINGGTPLYVWIFQRAGGSSASASGGGRIDATFFRPSSEPAPSATPSPSPTTQSPPAQEPERVARAVEFQLRKHLVAFGSVASTQAVCNSGVPVVVQRRSADGWALVRGGTSDDDGFFKARLPDRVGRYRAIVPRTSETGIICLRSISESSRHRHR